MPLPQLLVPEASCSMANGTLYMRAISAIWKLREPTNWASSGLTVVGMNLAPSSSTLMRWALSSPPCAATLSARFFCACGLSDSGCCTKPPLRASLAKNLPPNVSMATPMPMALRARVMGE